MLFVNLFKYLYYCLTMLATIWSRRLCVGYTGRDVRVITSGKGDVVTCCPLLRIKGAIAMGIIYDELELLEIFCNEHEVIDADASIFSYKSIDTLGYTLELFISVHENYVSFELTHENLKSVIYDIVVVNVNKIKTWENTLKVYDESEKQLLQVAFKPNFSLQTKF